MVPLAKSERMSGMIQKHIGSIIKDAKIRLAADELMKQGFDLVSTSKHLKFKSPFAAGTVVLPKTNSDSRAWHRVISQIRKTVGIDLKPIVNGRSTKKAA